MPDLLLELFSEEIPARMQAKACADLKKLVTDGLVGAGLTYAGAAAFSTPRRLALAIEGLTAESPSLREDRKGPRADAPDAAVEGFLRSAGVTRDQLITREVGKAQVLFALIEKPGRPAAVIVAEVVEHAVRNFPWPKSMRWGSGSLRWVRPLQSILCILSDEGGASVVPLEIDGIIAGNTTKGHRFMAPAAFPVHSFDDYTAKLKRAFVVLDGQTRADHIWTDATTAAFAVGMEVVPDAGLLAEVAGLVEWPVVLMGAIGEDFLGLPAEVLQTSMREHQKFFSVKNGRTGRIERFATVANRETADNGATILAGNQKVLSARLSDARFFWENDLRTVQQVGMEGMAAGLANVTFHNKLGSQAGRIARIAALAREIAPLVGADPDQAELAAKVAKADLQSAMVGEFPELQGVMGGYYARAAGLPAAVANACAAHYSPLGPSDTVPSEPVSVAVALADKIDTLTGFWAIDEKPTGSKDPFALRRAALGVLRLVLGNGVRTDLTRLMSIGMFGNAFKHGSSSFLSDPIQDWGWRRYHDISDTLQAFGIKGNIILDSFADDELFEGLDQLGLYYGRHGYVVPSFSNATERDIIEGYSRIEFEKLRLAHVKFNHLYDDLVMMEDEARREGAIAAPLSENIASWFSPKTNDLIAFLHDRLKTYLRDQSIPHDVINACLAMPGNDDLTLLVKRAEALAAFLKTDDGANLLQGFKRANNILTAEEKKDGVEYSLEPNVKFSDNDPERALFAALDTAEAAITPAMEREDFAAAMTAMAALRAPTDAFFTNVQVNADSQILRRNRLCLLNRIRAICLRVADLTKIEG